MNKQKYTKAMFKNELNMIEERDTGLGLSKWHNFRFGATKRKYGDYLYTQDRIMFNEGYRLRKLELEHKRK